MTIAHPEPNPVVLLPFAILLLTIATAPVFLREWWHKYHPTICAGFAAVTTSYYLFRLGASSRVLHAGMEYGSFMIVVGAFFVVAAGIHLELRGQATAAFNTAFLLTGALLGNVLGTVGASMLLIRPWIALNRNRFRQYHIAFFIFVISNIGGALLPIGPPLLLGYVKGVPFWWVLQRCWLPWSVMLGAVLLAFYLFDRVGQSRRTAGTPPTGRKLRCAGGSNFVVMGAILVCLIALPGGWRELAIALLAVAAYWIGSPEIRLRNEFTFAPLKEIAWIFLGIFGTMIPVLEYMERHASDLGLHSDVQFYWATGALSALLDNAPAYLTLFAGALGLHGLSLDDAQQISEFLEKYGRSLVAISLGATSFGALTYIGNGPNLLVKAIAEHANVPTPSFFGYVIKFALPVLVPVFLLVSLIFLR